MLIQGCKIRPAASRNHHLLHGLCKIHKQYPSFGRTNIINLQLVRKYAWTLSVPRSNQFSENKAQNSELQGTESDQEQIFAHIFVPNGGYCVYYPSNIICTMSGFENWRPQFQQGYIQSHDVFRPIAHEQKYLMHTQAHFHFK